MYFNQHDRGQYFFNIIVFFCRTGKLNAATSIVTPEINEDWFINFDSHLKSFIIRIHFFGRKK
jgi:hypothetical protein